VRERLKSRSYKKDFDSLGTLKRMEATEFFTGDWNWK
jgi:hypothetical protein